MTNPSDVTRVTPDEAMLQDGFGAKIAFGADLDVEFKEVSVTPPGADGGDAINTSNMYNSTYHTKAPQSLVEITDTSSTVHFNPVVLASIYALVNVNTTITVTHPDGDTTSFYGYLKSFIPNEYVAGTAPTAAIVIVATNQDPTELNEEGPVNTAGAGTP